VQVQASDPDAEFKSCRHCGRSFPSFQRRHRARDCPGYSEIWAGDQRVKIFAALNAYGDQVRNLGPEGKVLMPTVTAPGADHGLVWDEDHCRHLGDHKHSGPLGCRVAAAPADAWNKLAPTWWRRLHDRAAIAAERETGQRPNLLVRPWELQKRGMLHVHPILGYTTLSERRAAEVYVLELAALSASYGFGHVDKKFSRMSMHPRAAAAYVSSYFVTGKKGKMTLREAVTKREMPRSIIYVSPKLSQRSGVTMRTLRLRRYAWQLWTAEIEPRDLSEVSVGDIWQGLQEGKTLPAIVSTCLDR
jgi:hypothetical protein